LGEYAFKIQVSPLDCTGCGNCAEVCPAKTKALVMKPAETQTAEAAHWDYAMTLAPKEQLLESEPTTVKNSQFRTPLLEFSGACAGCGETPYAKLITQLFGDRMMIANATGCSSIWGGSAPSMPYTVNREGKGPAWANSLFEDNAEFGLGMFLGVRQIRAKLRDLAEELCGLGIDDALREKVQAWLDAFSDGSKTKQVSAEFLAALSAYAGSDEKIRAILRALTDRKDFFVKKSQWILGGDGWAYDIGYGGLDHVLASGEDVNVFVFDTEVYSNTGGQSSKSTPIGAVAQFAAAGKSTKKKDLGLMCTNYGYVYVAQIAMGASQNQAIRAILEAESYPGPSLVIGYAPCINHGIRNGMGCTQKEEKLAVEAGYWHLYRYNPLLKAEGKNPFTLDSKSPTASYQDFLMSEVRYSSLTRAFPERAKELFARAEAAAGERYDAYKRLSESAT
jgi:pyruvate-ferredoxin/flavodoxin oxidoreductase